MWNPYSVSFALFGGFCAFTIHAVSEEHAREQVRALRRSIATWCGAARPKPKPSHPKPAPRGRGKK